jgi:hypothetical protein
MADLVIFHTIVWDKSEFLSALFNSSIFFSLHSFSGDDKSIKKNCPTVAGSFLIIISEPV